MTALRAAYVAGPQHGGARSASGSSTCSDRTAWSSTTRPIPAAKPLARDVFVKEISQPGQTARIAAKAGEALVAKGYHAQATLADGTVSLFHLNAERAPIRIDGDTRHGRRAAR